MGLRHMSNIDPVADDYRELETPDMQTDDEGNRCYAVADQSARIVWVFAGTPGHLRDRVIAEARRQASRVAYRPVLSVE